MQLPVRSTVAPVVLPRSILMPLRSGFVLIALLLSTPHLSVPPSPLSAVLYYR